jgi:hypothetical protein
MGPRLSRPHSNSYASDKAIRAHFWQIAYLLLLKKAQDMSELIIWGKTIREDAHGNLNLTDIWHLAAAPSTKTPPLWRQLPTTDEYISAVARNIGKSYVKGKNDAKSVIYSKVGKGGGTFAHFLVALAYGEYLAPDLAVDIKATYARYRTGDLTLVDEIIAKADIVEKADAARKFQDTRDISKLIRNQYETTLASHGAAKYIGQCTNAIYEVLLGGTKKQIALQRNLPATANLRDNLQIGELLQTMNTEFMASERIEDLNLQGKGPCLQASRRSATIVKEAFDRERRDRRDPEQGI